MNDRLLTADCRLLTDLDRPRGAAALEIRRLDRIGEPLPQVLRAQLHPIDDDLEHLPVGQRRGLHVVERNRPAIDEQPAKAFSFQDVDRRRRGRPALGTTWTRGTDRPPRTFVNVDLFDHFVFVRHVSGVRRR